MFSEKLNTLALLSVENGIGSQLDLSMPIEQFARLKPRKINFI